MIRSFIRRFIQRIQPKADDVIVLRVPGDRIRREKLRSELMSLGSWPRLPGGALVLLLPADVVVSAEPKLKPAEDLGYGETKNQTVDAEESKRSICGATPAQ